MLETADTVNLVSMGVDKASQVSGLSKPFLRNEIRAKKLRVVRPGNSRRVLILMSDFLEYLNGGEKQNEK
jgi:hypothetical protein